MYRARFHSRGKLRGCDVSGANAMIAVLGEFISFVAHAI
jgi:hypothetical protein